MAMVGKAYEFAEIQNGSILVNRPKGIRTFPSGETVYVINTYATDVPSTGTIDARYSTAFTGCPPCPN